MGLGDWFSSFCKNITIQDDGTISNRYRAITQRLNTDYWSTTSDTAHSLYVGSYGRNTAIQGFSDLDMIFQLPYAVYERYDNYNGRLVAVISTDKDEGEKMKDEAFRRKIFLPLDEFVHGQNPLPKEIKAFYLPGVRFGTHAGSSFSVNGVTMNYNFIDIIDK